MEITVTVILIVLVIISWNMASERLGPLPKATQVGRKGHPASRSRNAWPSHPLPPRLPLLPDSHHPSFLTIPRVLGNLPKRSEISFALTFPHPTSHPLTKQKAADTFWQQSLTPGQNIPEWKLLSCTPALSSFRMPLLGPCKGDKMMHEVRLRSLFV